MKLLLLKTLLQRRARDEGFTLPMVIALGLVMLLLGAVSITTANEENLTAITQNSRSDALAIAEVGVARYRELLDRNRILTVYDERLPTTGEKVADIPVTNAQTKLWGRTEVCSSDIANFRQGATPQDIADTQDLDNDGNTTEIIGSYSLVSYDYVNNIPYDNTKPINKNSTPPNIPDTNKNGDFNLTNDGANNDAIGKLTVKGTAPDGSAAQIQVDIPIRINLADMTNLAPALWIGSNTPNLGNLTIGNGNVVIQDLPVTTGTTRDGCRSFSSLASTTPRRPVISDSRSIPSIQKIIDNVASARTALTKPTPSTINTPIASPGQLLFGATTDKPYNPDANNTNCFNIKLCRYYYEFGSTTSDLTSLAVPASTLVDTDLLTDGIARTTLLLNQPLTINAIAKNVKIGSTSPAANDSNTFEIYVNGNNNITINATGRNVTINAFIHAPQSTLTINGSQNVVINGSVWVKNFVNSASGVTISPDTISREATTDNSSTSGKGYEFYSTTSSRTARPITGSPTNWKTEEVN
ncbi:MAG TPA: hypothetical protein V6C71_21760 [Coleofasciculaceae cyanobacterium]|jgi:hypothetical protein